MTSPKLIMFDIFGTVFSLADIPREEIKAYVDHIRQPKWSPLVLPEAWNSLPAHDGAKEGIDELRKHAMVVTCSNGPLATQAHLAKHNDIHWDAIMPLELWQVYKPYCGAYLGVMGCLGFKAEETMMVTANESFGDLEAAKALGIQSCLICDNPEVERPGVLTVRSIGELAERLR
jgi:FMN phosphatase YigB (HAD superfamily)